MRHLAFKGLVPFHVTDGDYFVQKSFIKNSSIVLSHNVYCIVNTVSLYVSLRFHLCTSIRLNLFIVPDKANFCFKKRKLFFRHRSF